MKFGSVCSGIEAASLAFDSINIKPAWFSEIEDFPSEVLSYHYPEIRNYGDMNNLPDLILNEQIESPEILCGGTPCQAFSLAGWKEGLADERGQLTLKFIDIANAIDEVRHRNGLSPSIIMWENVEGVLRDKTNAFGCFISGLAGLDEPISNVKWSASGVLFGKTRNVAWRILDSKFFGLPQQRKRLYVIATSKNINPELILFEKISREEKLAINKDIYKEEKTEDNLFTRLDDNNNIKIIENNKIEVFRNYTDCLYSAYGTKWNGNAAAYNGSLYISQNDRIRRLTPLECERLMGFPDNYTNLPKAKDTNRYKAIGNSWAIQTIEWIAKRIEKIELMQLDDDNWIDSLNPIEHKDCKLYLFKKDEIKLSSEEYVNCSLYPNKIKRGDIFDIIDLEPKEKLFISSKALSGILRRKEQRNLKMNIRLEELFIHNISLDKESVSTA